MQAIRNYLEQFAGEARVRLGSASADRFMKRGQKTRTAEERARLYPNPLQGVGTLRRMTNRLANSLTGARNADGQDESIYNVTATAKGIEIEYGTAVPYAGQHEYGFSGSVNIPGHTRRITQAFGRKIEPRTVQVNSYTKMANIPARPYLMPAVESEMAYLASWLEQNLGDAILEEL